jgi:cathepsin B
MKYILISILLFSSIHAELHPVNEAIIQEIKATATWTPMEIEDNPFTYMPLADIKAMMGTKIDESIAYTEETLEGYTAPTNFDAREEWGKKIHPIRDQQRCGSCWAFGATEALSDRLAIQNDKDVVLSAEHLVSCDTQNYGCNGGYLDKAWEFMQKTGVASDTCYPYTSGTGQTGTCKSVCHDGSAFELHHASSYEHPYGVAAIKQTLQTNGPAEAAFTVYQDFMSYKEGVYEHKTGSMLGGHAIKNIGWGVDASGTDYWIMANSWGTSWGMDGFFQIKQGDCGIDGQIFAAKSLD